MTLRPTDIDSVEMILPPPVRPPGRLLHRAPWPLPSPHRRDGLGPFIFFDQMGPTVLGPGNGLDVRPSSSYRPRDGDLSARRQHHAPGPRSASYRKSGWARSTG